MNAWVYPDYAGRSIVNLMSSIMSSYGHTSPYYAPLINLPTVKLQAAQNVVLFVIDGLGYEYLIENGAGSRLHHHLLTPITSVAPATTATAISTFLTGLAPQQHGLTGWFTYFREMGSVLAVLPFKQRGSGIALGEAGISVTEMFGHVPIFNCLNVSSYSVSPAWIAHSDFNQAHLGPAELISYADIADCFAAISRCVKRETKRKYIYAYWPGFDSLAHEHGVGSEVVRTHFQELDDYFSNMLDDLAGTETLMIITADHGFVDVPAERVIRMEDHPELKDCLSVPLCGEPRLAYAYVRTSHRQKFEHYMQQHFAQAIELYTSEALRAQHLYGLGQPHPELASRTGDYTLILKDNYVIKDQIPGEGPFEMKGHHGGLSSQEMYVPLILVSC